jgi:hypothetical protein
MVRLRGVAYFAGPTGAFVVARSFRLAIRHRARVMGGGVVRAGRTMIVSARGVFVVAGHLLVG